MAAPSTAAQLAAAAAGDPALGHPLDGALRAAAVHSAAVVLTSAAQHVQRTMLLVEAATARALIGGAHPADQDADNGLALARASLREAMTLFEAAQDQARALGAAPVGT